LLTPAQLLSRLDRRLPLLTGGSRDAPVRQQTLRATIDWSYDLLDPLEQSLLARLAVFRGGATLDAVEAVCLDQDAIALGFPDLLDVVESLARQSLLVPDEDSAFPRIRLLETIGEYALERLVQSGERNAVATRHAGYFLDLAERAHAGLAGQDQSDWLDLLAEEHDNMRAALDDFQQRAAGASAVQTAGALWQFWWMRGHLSEGRERLRGALAVADRATTPPTLLARALDGAGALAEAQGDIAQAARYHQEALELWRRGGEALGQARSLENLGLIELHDRGNAARAQAHFATALALYQEEHDRQGIASVLRNLGDVALSHERFSEAAALYEDALIVARQLGRTRDIAAVLTSLGALAFFQADAEGAIRRYEESLALWRELGDLPGTALTLGNLGEAFDHAGDACRAKPLYAECLTISRELGDRQGVAFALSHVGRIARQEGQATRAVALLVESACICQEIDDSPRLAEALEGLAGALADFDAAPEAARLLGAARTVREHSASPRPTVHQSAYEHDLAAVRAALGQDRFEAHFAEGAATGPAKLLALVAGCHRGPGEAIEAGSSNTTPA
jgi:tetratricopeptide (TPR) repeat protein